MMKKITQPHPNFISTRTLRVFLVEDSYVIRDLIVEDLHRIPGVDVVGMSDTESDALEKLASESADVLVLDIQLKQGNGVNLLRSLLANAIQPHLVKVVLSNHTGGTYRRLCEQYGVRHFFDKTSEFSLLHVLLAQLSAGTKLDEVSFT